MPNDRPLPHPDRDSAPYWDSLSAGRFRIQRCQDCDTLRWPPRAICNRCHSFSADWHLLSGEGRIVSWTRTHQVFAPAYKDDVPYTVVQVRIAEQDDVLLIGGWCADREPVGDEKVRVRLIERTPDITLPYWEPI